MSGGFRFDFSPSADEGGGVAADGANELVSRLTERSRKTAGACTLLSASSKRLSVDDGGKESPAPRPSEEDDFRPHLRFHPHENIDLRSSKLEGLRHVIPRHTLSDDTTDLIPGVYEGGLKVWECSVDLCRFLAYIMIDEFPSDVSSTTSGGADLDVVRAAVRRSLEPGGATIELGCGHGLPGCLVLRESIRRTGKQGSNKAESDETSVVIFADFNDFVLHHATIPNAQLNLCGLRGDDGVAMDERRTSRLLLQRSIFAGGDWMGLSCRLSRNDAFPWPGALRPGRGGDRRLDLVLASETTYTTGSCEETAFLMLRHLKIDSGVGLVATKRFYFGVGGGTDPFMAACERLSTSNWGVCARLSLRARVIRSYDTGNANIRDLLCVTLHRKATR